MRLPVEVENGDLKRGRAAYLVIRGFSGPLDATFNAFLDVPEGVAPAGVDDPHYVGSFSLFGSAPGEATDIELPLKPDSSRASPDDASVLIVKMGGGDEPLSAEGAVIVWR